MENNPVIKPRKSPTPKGEKPPIPNRAEQAYGGTPKGGLAAEQLTSPLQPPDVPSDIATSLIAFMQRVELVGDEAYAYVRSMTYLRGQQELHQKWRQAGRE